MKYNFQNKDDVGNFLNLKKKKIYDFIIIGSGPAGCVIANELSTKYNILLIEEGEKFDAKFIKRRKIISRKLKIKKESLVVAIGGASNTWGSGSSYFEKFEMKDKNTNKILWPLSHNELLKYYRIVRNKYNLKFPKKMKSRVYKDILEREFYANSERLKFEKYLKNKKIDVLYNAKVVNLRDNKNSVSSLIKNKKNELKIESKKIILCCGTLENIRLINNSFIKNKKINTKILGKFFMNHPKMSIGEIKFPKNGINFNKYIFSGKGSYSGISLNYGQQTKSKNLNSFVRFVPIYKKIFKSNLVNRGLLKLTKKINKNIFIDSYKILAFLEMEPKEQNKVIIKRNNKIMVNYNFAKKDIDTLKKLQHIIYLNFSSNLKKEKILKINGKYMMNNSIDASHHIGGTRYHPSTKQSFVNKNLKIHGLRNCYICSSSIFPTSGSANPTATIIALAVRLASHFKTF